LHPLEAALQHRDWMHESMNSEECSCVDANSVPLCKEARPCKLQCCDRYYPLYNMVDKQDTGNGTDQSIGKVTDIRLQYQNLGI
jgi:hypothetical protein